VDGIVHPGTSLSGEGYTRRRRGLYPLLLLGAGAIDLVHLDGWMDVGLGCGCGVLDGWMDGWWWCGCVVGGWENYDGWLTFANLLVKVGHDDTLMIYRC